MPSRPRRSAAERASVAITDMSDRDTTVLSRSQRFGESRGVSGRILSADSSPSSVHVTGSNKRISGAASLREQFIGDDVVQIRRPTRGPKKRYVESESSDEIEVEEDEEDHDDSDDIDNDQEEEEEEEQEQQDEILVGDSDVDMDGPGAGVVGDEAEDIDDDADGDPDDLVDADTDGIMDMDLPPILATPLVKDLQSSRAKSSSFLRRVNRGNAKDRNRELSSNSRNKRSVTASGGKASAREKKVTNETVDVTARDVEEDDDVERGMHSGGLENAEGDLDNEIEVLEEDDGDEDDGDETRLSDDEVDSHDGNVDLSKMTRRQRARFEEKPQEYMKLSDEVQVKKHFTAEELSMRRAEMARRRRNLSDKRNEEVKVETINKLLKRQAPKTTKKNALGGGGDDDVDQDGLVRSDPRIVRWVNDKHGSRVAISGELLVGTPGTISY